jgi:uncharacterized protein (TIGR01777 family)
VKVVVSGITGSIGRALAGSLGADGHGVLGLSRREGEGLATWDPSAGRLDERVLEGADAIVHLAGRSLLTLWTPAARRAMWRSRVHGCALLARAMRSLVRPPRVFVTASAVGYYGDRGDEILTETSEPGRGFLSDLCRAWEGAADPAREAGVRVVAVRSASVLSSLLAPMRLPFSLGLGARLGSGRQWLSWIHMDDLVRVYRAAIEEDDLHGSVNAVAPGSVTNADFTRALARALGRPAFLAAPAFALRLVAGDLADQVMLASQRVKPAKLLARDFRFAAPDLPGALERTLAGRRP